MATLRMTQTTVAPESGNVLGFSLPVDALFETLTEDMDREVTAVVRARRLRINRAHLRRGFVRKEEPVS